MKANYKIQKAGRLKNEELLGKLKCEEIRVPLFENGAEKQSDEQETFSVEDAVERMKSYEERQRKIVKRRKCQPADYGFSFAREEEFRDSQAFRSYVKKFKKVLNDFLKETYVGYSCGKKMDDNVKCKGETELDTYLFSTVFNAVKRQKEKSRGKDTVKMVDMTVFEYVTRLNVWEAVQDLPEECREAVDDALHSLLERLTMTDESDVPKCIRQQSREFKKGFLDSVAETVCVNYLSLRLTDDVNITKKNYQNFLPETNADKIMLTNAMHAGILREVEECLWYLAVTKAQEYFSASSGTSDLKAEIDQSKRRNAELEKKIAKKEETIEELKAKIDKLERTMQKEVNKRVHEVLKEKDAGTQKQPSAPAEEPQASIQVSEPAKPEKSIDELSEPFRSKRIVFIRKNEAISHPVMKKLADYFPNSSFTNGIDCDIDVNTDVAVVLTRYICHGVYSRTKNFCKTKGVKYIHCDKSAFEHIIRTMADALANTSDE